MGYRTFVAAIALLAGCGTTIRTTTINPAPHAMQPRPPASVQIYSSGPPQLPYVDVAYLEAEQTTSLSVHDTPEMLANLRKQAAAMGCDGVVLGGITHSADSVVSVAADVSSSRKGITATCIMFLPPTATAMSRHAYPQAAPPPAAPPPAAHPPAAPPPAAPLPPMAPPAAHPPTAPSQALAAPTP